MALGSAVQCEKQNATGSLVEAMHDAHARIGRTGRRQIQLPAEHLQDAVGLGAAGNDSEARWLLNRDPVRRLAKDLQGFARHAMSDWVPRLGTPSRGRRGSRTGLKFVGLPRL